MVAPPKFGKTPWRGQISANGALSRRPPIVFVLVCIAAVAVGSITPLLAPRLIDIAGALGVDNSRLDSPAFGIVVLSATVVATIALSIWPQWPVFACCLLLPFNFVGGLWTNASAPVVSFAKLAVDAIFVISVVGVVLAPRSRVQQILGSPIGRSILALLAAIGFATLLGLVSLANSGRVSDWAREANWLWFYAFFIPVGVFVDSRRRLLMLIAVLLMGVLAAQLVSLWVFETSPKFVRVDFAGSASFQRTLFSEPSVFILFLAFIEVFILWPRGLISTKWLLTTLPVLGLLVVGLAATLGRGLWLSTALGLIVMLPFVPRIRRTLAVVLGLLVPALFVVPTLMNSVFGYAGSGQTWLALSWDFLLRVGSTNDVSVLAREIEWTNAVSTWLLSPLVGVGLGAPYPATPLNSPDLAPFYLHNSYLNILAKMGVLGAATFVVVIVLAGHELVRSYRRQTDHQMKAVTLAAAATFVQMLAYSITSPALTTTDSVMFAGVILGLAFSTSQIALTERVE